MTLAEKADAVARLREAFIQAGRDPATLDICDGLASVDNSIARTLDQIPAHAEAGITIIRVHLRRLAPSPDEVLSTLDEVVRHFEPYRALTV
jgi:hypothetical protein